MADPRRVTEWTRYSESFHKDLQLGDLIEIAKTRCCSHYGVYFKDDQLVHFINAGKLGIKGQCRVLQGDFNTGAVTVSPLEKVAGSSKIRVNNKPKNKSELRPVEEISEFIELLVDKPGFYFSLLYFNCEHFSTYLKFVENSQSNQADKWMKAKRIVGSVVLAPITPILSVSAASGVKGASGLLKSIWDPERKKLLREAATKQWRENTQKSKIDEMPNLFLPDMVDKILG